MTIEHGTPTWAYPKDPKDCKHDGSFRVRGGNRLMHGTCMQCGAEVHLQEILNSYFARLDAVLKLEIAEKPAEERRAAEEKKLRAESGFGDLP